jgi:hypothetical protein
MASPLGGGIPSDKIITEWVLDAEGHKGDLKKLARAYRAQAKHEKDLAFIRKKLDGTTQKASVSTNKLTTQTKKLTRASKASAAAAKGMKVAVAGLVAMGVKKLTGAFIDAVKEGDKFSQAARIYTGDINAARAATRGLATDMDIMVAKNRLMTLGVKMTDKEFNRMLGHLTKISSAMSIDMKFALESATTMLARQSTAVADNVGVVIKAQEAYDKYATALGTTAGKLTATQKKLAFQKEALIQLATKAGELEDKTVTMGGEMEKFGTTFSNVSGALFSSIGKWRPLIDIVQALSTALKQAAIDMSSIHTGKIKTPQLRSHISSRMNEAMRQLRSMGFDPLTGRRVRGTGQLASVTKQSVARLLAVVKLEQKRLDMLSEQDDLLRRQKRLLAGEIGEPLIQKAAPLRVVKERIVDTRRKKRRRARKKKGIEFKPMPSFAPLPPDELPPVGDFPMGGMADAAAKFREYQKEARGAAAATDQYINSLDALSQASQFISDSISTVFESFKQGLVAAIDAAISGTGSFLTVLAKSLKATLLTIAVESAIQALFATAKGLFALASLNVPAATNFFAAAGKFALTAVAAGGGGALLGLATKGGASTASGTSSKKTSSTATPSFGRRVESKRPIVINLMLGDGFNDPAMSLLLRKQVQTQVMQQTA